MNWRRRHDEACRRRSVSELLSKLSEVCATERERSETVQNERRYETDSNRANIYRVLWAKPSSRKKRVWEGDGSLNVEGNVATLFDEDGRVLGAGPAPPPHVLACDSIFTVGGKQVEIVEQLLKSNPAKHTTSERKQNSVKFSKKLKSSDSPCVVSLRPPKSFNRARIEPLTLVAPPSEHQWKHNELNKPITVVNVDTFLTSHLRPHQREGISFLYECVMGFRSEHTGAILADEMGLGKTLQSISLIWTLLRHGPYGSAVIKRALIIAPSTLCATWEREFLKWLGRERVQPFLIDNNRKPKHFNLQRISPVMIISYERLIKHIEDVENINFHLIVCDEAHRLKNSNIKIAQCFTKLSCKRRILLTGTPFQNDFQEYFVLVEIANPGILGTYKEFKQNYEEPIVLSRNSNCSKEEHEIGEKTAAQLHFLTSNFILRRTQTVLEKILPAKTEYVLFCNLTSVQKELYIKAIDDWWINKEFASASPLCFITHLKKICNHPSLLKMGDDTSEEFSSIFLKHTNTSHGLNDASKIIVLRKLLKNVMDRSGKIVIVSSSTMMLNILAQECDSLNFPYLRLDGSTPVQSRQNIVNSFNSNFKKSDCSKIQRVLLLSSRAGGVGLSLPGGSHLVLYDSDWNPAVDNQAMARIWRDGQKNPVHIYRFLSTGTIEEKIYQRQIHKTNLSDSVMQSTGDSSIKLSETDLKDLFSVNFDSECTTHDMIECKCQGIGDQNIVENLDDSEESVHQGRLDLFLSKHNTLGINNLYEWEHFRPPFDSEFLRESSLEGISENISFIFRKICQK